MAHIQYRGYTIRVEEVHYAPKYKLFPTGNEDDDADFDGDSYRYTGNGKWCDTIDQAKATIDEECAIASLDESNAKTHYRVFNTISKTITKFDFWYQAKTFCDSLGIDVMCIKHYVNGQHLNFDSI